MNKPFLSIIIPIYNTEQYLITCIESILKQDFHNYEIILVDDGSTDGSSAICDNYTAKYSHIQCIHQKNSGHTTARQAGFKASQGTYIAFADSDDWVAPDMYTDMCAAAQQSHADIIHCDFIAAMPDREKICGIPFAPGYYTKEELIQSVYPKMIYSGTWFSFGAAPNIWNKIFKRELLAKFLFTIPKEIILGEDLLTTYSCLLEADSVYFIDKPYYYYRSRSNSYTHCMNERYLDNLHLLMENCIKMIDADRYPTIRRQLDYYFAQQTLLILIPILKNKLRDPDVKSQTVKAAFLEECNNQYIRHAFMTIKISDVKGYHNKIYAFCIRYKWYRLFKLFLLL